MNCSNTDAIVGSRTSEDRRCARCGARPKLIWKTLDTRRGCIVRMFECVCGEHSWAEDREAARNPYYPISAGRPAPAHSGMSSIFLGPRALSIVQIALILAAARVDALPDFTVLSSR
jgi:hypothetical protein